MITLPPELWEIIFTHRRKMMWKDRKAKLHKQLHYRVIPTMEHERHFMFHNYLITYFRTPHLEITVTIKNNNHTQINHVLYLYTPSLPSHETRFCYLPPYYLR